MTTFKLSTCSCSLPNSLSLLLYVSVIDCNLANLSVVLTVITDARCNSCCARARAFSDVLAFSVSDTFAWRYSFRSCGKRITHWRWINWKWIELKLSWDDLLLSLIRVHCWHLHALDPIGFWFLSHRNHFWGNSSVADSSVHSACPLWQPFHWLCVEHRLFHHQSSVIGRTKKSVHVSQCRIFATTWRT